MLLHRHYITALLQALLVLFTCSACLNDEFGDDIVGTGATGGSPYYLTMHIKFDSNITSTRAINGDNLEYGDEKEHFVGKEGNWIILFKGDSFFGAFPLTELTSHNHNSENPDDDNIDDDFYDNIEAIYSYSSKFEAEDEDALPNSCLVVLNSSEKIENQLKYYNNNKGSVTVQTILDLPWDETDKDGDPRNIGFSNSNHDYFILTNSVYYTDHKRDTVGIPKGFIGKSLMAAKPLTIYAERMVSKFSFTDEGGASTNHIYTQDNFPIVYCNGFTNKENEDNAMNYAPQLEERFYQIRLTGWGINAFETKNHIFRKINNKTYFTGWNNPANYRAHWSEDPHYDEENGQILKYPWQYRLAVDYPLDYYKEKYPEIGDPNDNYLKNYTFDELNITGFNPDRVVYTPENTYDPTIYDQEKDFDTRIEKLAGTHLIVCADLETKLNDAEGYKANDVYRDRKGIFYKDQKDCFWSLVRAFNLALQSEIWLKYNWYEWNATKGKLGVSRDALVMKNEHYLYDGNVETWDKEMAGAVKSDNTIDKDRTPKPTSKLIQERPPYKLYYKGEPVTYDVIMGLDDDLFVDATIKDGDGKVLPWLDNLTIENADGEKLEIFDKVSVRYNYEDGKAVIVGNKLRDAETDDVKSLILEWMGAVDHFNNGKMYYAAPVKHYAAQEDYTAEQDETGHYGVVRNNWYKFNLKDVTKIGTPVDDPTEPIVPNKVTTNDQLNITVNIIPWHDFETTAKVL